MKKNRLIAAIMTALLAASLFTACNNTKSDTSNPDTASISSSLDNNNSLKENNDNITVETMDTAEMFTDRDLSGEYDEKDAVTIEGKDKTFSINGEGASADGNVLTISQEGVYILSGTVTDGRIVIDADDKAKVQLVLKDFSLTSSDYSALYVKTADKVFVTLADNTKNVISDGSTYKELSEEDNVNSAIFSKSDLTINGTGSLTVNGNLSHAIVSKDDLKITGGTINAASVGSAICGKDSVRIADGTINVTSGGDGIKSTNDSDASKGYVYIGGGKISVTSETDGIQAQTVLTCENSDITLNTGGGSENSSKTHSDNFGGWGKWGMNDTNTASSEEDSSSAKGLKADSDIIIDNSTITADTADDSIHSKANANITGGTLELTSGDDGIHADSSVTISGGKVTITKSCEGIEGSNITISGGEIDVTASDDGLNTAGGSDQSAMGGRFGQNNFTADSNVYLKITGGTLHVNAGGDGLDSNNTISIEGGTVYVDGPTDNGNSAIDFETEATISGGTLIALGSSGMAESLSEKSSQASILYNLSESHKAGEKVTLKSESGEEIISYTSNKAFNSVTLSSPDLTSNGKYTLTVGSETVTIEMTSNAYSNGGGMGGMGRMGGMPPEGDMPSDMGEMRGFPNDMDGSANAKRERPNMPDKEITGETAPNNNSQSGNAV